MARAKKSSAHSETAAINILVSVDEQHIDRLEGVASDLRSAGMRVAETFPLSGTIAGDVSIGDFSKVHQVAGVAAVERESEFRAYQ